MRQISFTLNDGAFNSTPVFACLRLDNVNDPPTLSLGANDSIDVMLMYLEGQSEPLFLATELLISDLDTPISSALVFLPPLPPGQSNEERLDILELQDFTVSRLPRQLVVTAPNLRAEVSVFQDVLRSTVYSTTRLR